MAWPARWPLTTSKFPAAQHMDDLRAAINERNELLDADAAEFFDPPADYRVSLPTDISVGDFGRHMVEYQDTLLDVDAYGDGTLVYPDDTWDVYPWCAGAADDFATLVDHSPGSGEINILVHAGLGGITWRKRGGAPVSGGDKGDILHPNDLRLVLNKLVRLKSCNLLYENPQVYYNDSSSTPCGVTETDTDTWANVRAAAFAAAATYPGSGGGYAGVPLLGRTSKDMDPTDAREPDNECEVNCTLKCKATVTLDFGASASLSAAWLLIGTYDVATAHGGGYDNTAEFDIGVYVGGNRQGGVTTGTAADISGFICAEQDADYAVSTFDAWLIAVDPADLDPDGDNVIELRFESSVTADPGYAEGEDYCQAMISGTDEPHMALVLEFDHFTYL